MKLKSFLMLIIVFCGFPAFADSFDSNYQAYQGDYNNDGRTDFYFRKPLIIILHGDIATPIASNQDADGFILKQNADKTFSIQPNTNIDPSGWMESSVQVILQDLNIDGIKDILLRNVSSIVYGAFDQIVFANPATGGQPLHVRAVDDDFRQFFQNTASWISDPNYFYQDENFLGNYCVEGYWVPIYGYYYDYYYDAYVYGTIGYYVVCTEYVSVYNGSIYHPESIELFNGLVEDPYDANSRAKIIEVLSEVLGVPFGDSCDAVYSHEVFIECVYDNFVLYVKAMSAATHGSSSQGCFFYDLAYDIMWGEEPIAKSKHDARLSLQSDAPQTFGGVNTENFHDATNSIAHNLGNTGNPNLEIRGKVGTDREGWQLIYKGDSKKELVSTSPLVTNHNNIGTYDYSPPPNLSQLTTLATQSLLGHFQQDVTPWIEWKNSDQDETDRKQRVEVLPVPAQWIYSCLYGPNYSGSTR